MIHSFTASQIAGALGKSRAAALKLLSTIPPASSRIVRGQSAGAWSLEQLPQSMFIELCRVARRGGYRSAVDLLNGKVERWNSPIPMKNVCEEDLNEAAKLQRAIRPLMQSWRDGRSPAAELLQRGRRNYTDIVRKGISERQMRRVFDRTLERAGVEANFDRLEIYLPNNPKSKSTAPPKALPPRQSEFQELLELVQGFTNPAEPNTDELTFFWKEICQFYFERFEAAPNSVNFRKQFLQFLLKHFPYLSANQNSLRVTFDRKLRRFIEADNPVEALTDKRRERKNEFDLPDADKDRIIHTAVTKTGGRISQAWREVVQGGGLSEETANRYALDWENKSYVPKKIRQAVTPDARNLKDIHHGKRRNTLTGAYISRDWSKVPAGDWWCADDLTAPVYFLKPDGAGWYTMERGQVLLICDLRTTRILNFCLIPEKQYSSFHIRTLMKRACLKHGLPKKGFVYENGLWRKSKLVKGSKGARVLSNAEVAGSFERLGLKFIHAKLPRAKPVERVFGAIQNAMESLPGYAGRAEMTEGFENLAKLKLAIDARRVDPTKYLFTLDEWENQLKGICEAYNAEPQNGKMIALDRSRSPEAAYLEFQNPDDPPVQVDAAWQYLLAREAFPLKVTGNGITLRIGKKVFVYRSPETGERIGETMLLWFDPEFPESAVVSDMKCEEKFMVDRAPAIPGIGASSEQFTAAYASANAQNEYVKTRYVELTTKFGKPFRKSIVAPDDQETGKEFNRLEAEHKEKTKTRSRQQSRNRRLADKIGYGLPRGLAEREDKLDDAAELAREIERIDGMEEHQGGDV